MKESPYSYNRVRKTHASHYLNTFLCRMSSLPSPWLWLSFLGSFDISSLSDSKGQAPKTAEMPMYVNTQQIDAQVLAALQAEAEHVTKGMAAAAKESPQKDLFDMSESCLADVTFSFHIVWCIFIQFSLYLWWISYSFKSVGTVFVPWRQNNIVRRLSNQRF